MLTDAERAEMAAEARNILARHQVKGEGAEALCVALERWMNDCVDAAVMVAYARGQRSVLAPR